MGASHLTGLDKKRYTSPIGQILTKSAGKTIDNNQQVQKKVDIWSDRTGSRQWGRCPSHDGKGVSQFSSPRGFSYLYITGLAQLCCTVLLSWLSGRLTTEQQWGAIRLEALSLTSNHWQGNWRLVTWGNIIRHLNIAYWLS